MSRFYAKIEAISYNKETQGIIFAARSVHAVITLCVIINERLFCSYLEGYYRFNLERADGWQFEHVRKKLFV